MRRDDIIRAHIRTLAPTVRQPRGRWDPGSDAIRAAGAARTSKEDGMEPKTGYD